MRKFHLKPLSNLNNPDISKMTVVIKRFTAKSTTTSASPFLAQLPPNCAEKTKTTTQKAELAQSTQNKNRNTQSRVQTIETHYKKYDCDTNCTSKNQKLQRK
jgi:hypothetical protein